VTDGAAAGRPVSLGALLVMPHTATYIGPMQVKRTILGLAAAVAMLSAAALPAVADTIPVSRSEITLSFAPLVKKAAPAVVNIYAKKVVRRPSGGLFSDPLLRRFFGEDWPFGDQSRKRIESSLGSGVIVRPEGVIVTNHHVIENADEITVVMSDRRELDARVLLTDERTDIAVLKIDPGPESLAYLEFADSDDLEVGDLVLAIGNPFGVGQTVTSGIVSGLARTTVGVTDFRSFIQTDAAINPGNSGGALIGVDGRLVGVNTAIFSRSGGSLGIGFAVPANMVDYVVTSALSGDKLVRPWVGFSGRDVTAEVAEALGLRRPGGVLVEGVFEGGPADKAGLKRGDVIRAMGKKALFDAQHLRFRLATKKLGETAILEVIRDGKTLKLEFVLVAPPEDPPRDRQLISRGPLAGMAVGNLSPALAQELGMSAIKGVVALEIKRSSSAHRLRFRPRDIIVSMNGKDVKSSRDLVRMSNEKHATWSIVLVRNGRRITFEVG